MIEDIDNISFSNINKTWRFQQLFLVSDTGIVINPGSIRNGFLQSEKELFFDFFCTKYQGQQILCEAGDGENLQECGLYDFLERLIFHGLVQRENILIRTYDTHFAENFPHRLLPPGLLWATPEPQGDFSSVNPDAKFAGITVGRFTPARFRMAKELHTAFGSDTFIIFNPSKINCEKFFNRIDSDNGVSYDEEINWIKTHDFDKDDVVDYNQLHNTPQLLGGSISGYHSFWPKYYIELVAETDVLCNHWFTEKTSRCLQTGKPFLLLSGQHSLKRLKEIGFATFDSVIDESYDDEYLPARKVFKIIDSLRELYNSPDRAEKIQQLYEIGKRNIKLFPKLQKLYTQIYDKRDDNKPLPFPSA